MASAPAETPLHERLLHAPAQPFERRPTSRWVYPLWGILLASVFVLYHVSVLLVWNMPSKGLSKQFHTSFMNETKGGDYFRGTRLTQSWGMFAPNPNRTNTFVRVFVEDKTGQIWDFEQDIWEENRYPYIWYDRRGKVNRNIDGKKHHQRVYGAWVCREWERRNGGEAAKSVTFIKRWTYVPKPIEVIERGGWNQWEAPFKQVEQETITCKTVVHGTLPNYLRERYGLPLLEDERLFRPVVQRTWWDKQERERRLAEQQAAMQSRQAARREAIEQDEPVDEDSPDQ